MVLLLALLPLKVIGKINGISSQADIPNLQNTTSQEITLLSFNVWVGGTVINDGQFKVLNAILMSGADMVGISEARNNIGTFVADKLGWYRYVTNNDDIVSRFPIRKTWKSRKGVGAEIELENGKMIVLKTVHLHYTPYGPYRACFNSASVEQIINEETTSGRLGEINSALSSINTYLKSSTPTFLMGDLNTPSHLDWIEATAEQHCGYVVEWPVTKAIADSGMIDAFREAYPDPAVFPGITWSPIYETYLNNGKPEPMDRIDFIYYSGDSLEMKNTEIFVVGTPEQLPLHHNNEWPSDHAAVVSTFSIETGVEVSQLPIAKFYANTPVVNAGDSVQFTDITTKNPTNWSWSFEGGEPETSNKQNPVIFYNAVGEYTVSLIAINDQGSDTTTVKKLIKVKPFTGQSEINTDKNKYNLNETITVFFNNGPGNAKDWIGIYKQGDIPGVVSSTLWYYVNGSRTAGQGIAEGSVTFSSGLSTSGSYWTGFFENDGYALLDSTSFTVSDLTDISLQYEDQLFPKKLTLKNFPNPFNPETKILFSLPKTDLVTLKIYDTLGKEVTTLIQEEMQQGEHAVQFSPKHLASGVYFAAIQMGEKSIINKMLFLQ